MNTLLLIKALCKYKKSKKESLKYALRHDRLDISDKRIDQILEIDILIDELEYQLINERLNILI